MNLLDIIEFPHLSIGFGDFDSSKETVVFWTDLDLNSHILGYYWEETSKSIHEHLINLAELLDEIEVSISKNWDIIHEFGIMVGSVSKAVDWKTFILQYLLIVLLDSDISSTILTITQ